MMRVRKFDHPTETAHEVGSGYTSWTEAGLRWARALILIGLITLMATPPMAATYEIKPEKSRIRFEIGHSDYAKPVRGRFAILTGQIDYDATKPEAAAARLVIDASSIDTDNGYRDEHLRSSFFEADRFPDIQFRLTRILVGEGKVEGELTMKGVTRTVTLAVSNVRELEGPEGMRVLRVRAKTRVNRRDFGIEEDADRAEGLGKLLAHIQEGLDEFIDDEVEINLSIVAHEVPDGVSGESLAALD